MKELFKPKPYQNKAIDYILDRIATVGVGLFLDMGLGKTVVVLTAIKKLLMARVVNKILVVAPLRVANSTWPAEVNKWEHLNELSMSVITGTKKQRENAIESVAPIHVVNYENLVWLRKTLGKAWPYDLVVFDELSKMKSPGSKRFRSMRGIAKKCHTIGLTGTPTPNGLLDLWAQVFLLDNGERLGRTFTGFRSNWFEQDYSGYRWTPRSETDAWVRDAVSGICISMSADDYLNLPDKIYNIVPVQLPAAVRRQYEKLKKALVLELEKGDTHAATAAVLSNKCLQLTNGALYLNDELGHPTDEWQDLHNIKLDALEDIIEEAAGAPVLVAYNFKFDLVKLQQRFPHARQLKTNQDIDDWNAGKASLLLAHPASAGHGLNLQDGGSIIVWYGLNWSLELYEQFNARLHRQGQTKPVFVHHIVMQNTVDELVMERLRTKKSVQDVLLEGLKIHRNEN